MGKAGLKNGSQEKCDTFLSSLNYCSFLSDDSQVVSLLAFYSDNPSSNPDEANFFLLWNVCWKRTEINKKEAVDGQIKKA